MLDILSADRPELAGQRRGIAGTSICAEEVFLLFAGASGDWKRQVEQYQFVAI